MDTQQDHDNRVQAEAADTFFDLDILGQQPSLSLYTQLCFCFSLPESASTANVIDTLNSGLTRLVEAAPWIGGQIVNEGATPGNSGTYRIGELGRPIHLAVKDYREDANISYEKLRNDSFPARLLTEDLYASRKTIPYPPKPDAPVFEVQANFITGGLILTIVGQHQAMDMTGQDFLIKMYSKACRGEAFSEVEIQHLNTPRRESIPLSIPSSEESKIDSTTTSVQSNDTAVETAATVDPVPSQPCSWTFFNFSAKALYQLKQEASASLTSGYVSTDDTLTAFIWSAVTRARSYRLRPDTLSGFGRAVDVRRYFGYTKSYPGLLQSVTYHKRTSQKLTDAPLGSIASELRTAVDPTTTKLVAASQDFATQLQQARDKSKVNFTGSLDFSKDLILSSWAAVDGYKYDFGLGLGFAEMVRRPSFTPVEGLAYLMPKTPEGDVALMICARDQDLEQLRLDLGFKKYATFIG